MSTKKMLALLGSPRKNGKIAKMLNHAVETVKKRGYEVNFISLYEKNLSYCKGCMACRKTGSCILKDDLTEIAPLLKECDVLVLAAPTYFANVPACVKNFFDRIAGLTMDDNNSTIPKPKLSSKQGYLLITSCTTPSPFDYLAGQSKGCLRAMDEVFKTAGMHHLGNIVLAGSRSKKEVPAKILEKIERKIPN